MLVPARQHQHQHHFMITSMKWMVFSMIQVDGCLRLANFSFKQHGEFQVEAPHLVVASKQGLSQAKLHG